MRTARMLALTGLGLSVVALSGCNHGDSTLAEWRRQPTPMLMSTAETKVEIQNRETRVNDHNLRAFHEDAARFWLLDRPSRLGRGPSGI